MVCIFNQVGFAFSFFAYTLSFLFFFNLCVLGARVRTNHDYTNSDTAVSSCRKVTRQKAKSLRTWCSRNMTESKFTFSALDVEGREVCSP